MVGDEADDQIMRETGEELGEEYSELLASLLARWGAFLGDDSFDDQTSSSSLHVCVCCSKLVAGTLHCPICSSSTWLRAWQASPLPKRKRF